MLHGCDSDELASPIETETGTQTGTQTGTETDTQTGIGCSDAQLTTLVQDMQNWPITRSCGHATFGIGTADETLALLIHFSIPNAGQEPYEVGQIFEMTLDPNVEASVYETPGSLHLDQGLYLMDMVCDDAVEHKKQITQTFMPNSGRAILEVTDAEDKVKPWGAAYFTGTLTISGVTVVSGGQQCVLPDLSWSGLPMGWLPG